MDKTVDSCQIYVATGRKSLLGVDLFDLLGFRLRDPSGEQVNIINHSHMAQYPSLFTDFRVVTEYCHAPQVDQSVRPVSQGLRRLPFAVREEVSAELRRLESDDII